MKTFALVLYLITSGGNVDRFVVDYDLTARDCAHRLTEQQRIPPVVFKGGRQIEKAVVACEEETAA